MAFACALAAAGAAAGATPKPFQVNAKTCAAYVSPAYVKSATGLVGTPQQKMPNGQCHFVVGGVKDAFSVTIFVMKSPQQALAILNEGYSQDVAAETEAGLTCPSTADVTRTCPPPQRISGIGSAAVLYDTRAPGDTGPYGISEFETVRGALIISVASGPPAYMPAATEEAIAKHMLAVIPK